jgi:membrane protein insertase Oxa1/YidC/SpoIIIJ
MQTQRRIQFATCYNSKDGGHVEHHTTLGRVRNSGMATGHMQLWGSIPIPHVSAILLIPVLAMVISFLLTLISSCDPHSPLQFSTSGAAMVVMPPIFILPL